MKYKLPPYQSCSFCQDFSGDRECGFVTHEKLASALVNERQYELGAMLVIPRAHRETVQDITEEEISAVYNLARNVALAATRAYNALGVNIYQNNGLIAGQHEPHFHVHVVPRYKDSDPGRRFLQKDFEPISVQQQRQIAATIQSQL